MHPEHSNKKIQKFFTMLYILIEAVGDASLESCLGELIVLCLHNILMKHLSLKRLAGGH